MSVFIPPVCEFTTGCNSFAKDKDGFVEVLAFVVSSTCGVSAIFVSLSRCLSIATCLIEGQHQP